SSMGCRLRDHFDLILLMLTPERFLFGKPINKWFNPDFFKTNFWFLWSSMFAFEPWHSVVEMRRYMRRFLHQFSNLATMQTISHTRYAQYFSIVMPLIEWLSEHGVQFNHETQVTDIVFDPDSKHITVKKICYQIKKSNEEIQISPSDLVLFCNGSMIANSAQGSMSSAPQLTSNQPSGAWDLWKKIAAERPGLGNPEAFCANINQTKWESFTVTSRNPAFKKAVELFTKRALGRSGLITFKDSAWMLSLYFHYNPIIPNQPEDTFLWWGYGLFPDRKGNYIKKAMSKCTGSEILAESLHHLKMIDLIHEVEKTSVCIPTMMPYITAQFMPRKKNDRPEVVPKNSTNLAFIGQFCEQPDDVVFTVEYSVRSARAAIAHFFPEIGHVPGIYKGYQNPLVLLRALKVLIR
ncbi:MAG: oleate hydratase, partial [Desulfamplus sp.]|nr:oleate hydratase [Desulfamplus sp.]